MTVHKHLKHLIRDRMEKTGERYSAARRSVIETADQDHGDPATRWHFAGNVPATTAFRTMLAHAGVRAPHTGEPFSEAMLFGIAGGIGIGVFSFYYQKPDIATFYVSGRHQAHSDASYLEDALDAFEIDPVIRETSGARTAGKQLEEAIEQFGPCAAWVEGYRVVTVYDVDPAKGTARIGDLTDEPLSIPLSRLTERRMRIKKQRCRLLSIPPANRSPDLSVLVDSGLRRCSDGFLNPTIPMMKNNARLEALRTWADRMHGSGDKESWSRTFRPGPNLLRGLWGIYTFIEHYGTGGGLCRPIFAEFLEEAATALSRPDLAALSKQYAALGRAWSDLAYAALPDSVPALREARELHISYAECKHAGEKTAERSGEFEDPPELNKRTFPLSEADSEKLRAELRTRIMALYEGEVAAHDALRNCLPHPERRKGQ
jgi:Domain of unknown function (DUF4872)